MIKKERNSVTKSLREEMEESKPNLSTKDMDRLEYELTELSNLIIDSYLLEKIISLEPPQPNVDKS